MVLRIVPCHSVNTHSRVTPVSNLALPLRSTIRTFQYKAIPVPNQPTPPTARLSRPTHTRSGRSDALGHERRKDRPADFHVAVDIALFSLRNDLLHIGVVQRRGGTSLVDQNHLNRRRDPAAPRRVTEVTRDPDHHWALPGGHVGHKLLGDRYGTGDTPDASLEAAALRVLGREVGITLGLEDLHQVGAFGDANRDPRSGHTISIAYLAVVGDDRDLERHPDDAVGHVSRVQFRPVVDVLARPNRLEFDHEDILMAAIRLLRNLVVTTPLATRFCRDEFTLGELRRVYEVIFHQSLDSAEQAEQPEHATAVRKYLTKLEQLSASQTPDFERTVNELALLRPTVPREVPDLQLADGSTVEVKRHRSRRSSSEPGFASRSMNSLDFARQAELLSRLVRQSSGIRSPRPPRLIKALDPTNFARKIQKLGILEPVHGGSRPTFDRYGKPAALFRLNRHRDDAPFLLRLDNLGRSETSE